MFLFFIIISLPHYILSLLSLLLFHRQKTIHKIFFRKVYLFIQLLKDFIKKGSSKESDCFKFCFSILFWFIITSITYFFINVLQHQKFICSKVKLKPKNFRFTVILSLKNVCYKIRTVSRITVTCLPSFLFFTSRFYLCNYFGLPVRFRHCASC